MHSKAQANFKIYLYQYIPISFLMAGIAQLMVGHVPIIDSLVMNPAFDAEDAGSPGQVRAIIYFIIGYAFVMPVYVAKLERNIRGLSLPGRGLSDRFLLTVLGVSLSAFALVFPFVFLLTSNIARGRAGMVYAGLTNSYLGLALAGAPLLYGITIMAWVLVCRIPGLWIRG